MRLKQLLPALLMALMGFGSQQVMAGALSDAFSQGNSMASGQTSSMFSNINTTTAQANIPAYSTTAPAQSSYYDGGNGNIEGPGAAQIPACASATPGTNAQANEYCDAVNFLATNPSVRPQITISPHDTLLTNSLAISNNPNTILQNNGMSSTGTTSQCVPVTTTTPAQYTTQMCTTVQGMATMQCVIGRVVNINANTNYQCNQTVNAYQTQTCDRTLIVSIPSTIPATPDYSCASGQILIGQQCQSPSIAASVNYSCSAGSSLNGTTCQPAPSTPTASYSCGSGQTLSGTSCQAPATNATLNYSCNIGDTLNGSTCTPPSTSTAATANYSCASGSTLEGSMCQAPATQGAGVAWTNNACNTSFPSSFNYSHYSTKAGSSVRYLGQCYVVNPPTLSSCISAGEGEIEIYQEHESCRADCAGVNISDSWAAKCVPNDAAYYSCPAGYTLSGSTCYPPAVTPSPTPANVSYSCSSGTLSGTSCVTNGVPYNATSTYTCPSGTTVSGSQCVSPVTSATASYSCPTGNSLVNSQCYPPPVGATTSYTCPASYIINGTNCAPPLTPATITYTCAAGMMLSGSSCQPAPTTSWQDGCSALEAQAL